MNNKREFIELSENELKNVSGGTEIGGTRRKPCKYCNTLTTQTYMGKGTGYRYDMKYEDCDLFECSICNNTNYWAKNGMDLL